MQKLEGLTEIPAGYSFNAAGLWKELEGDLQPVQKHRSAFRWLAAAVLLLAVAVSGFFLQKGYVSKPVMAGPTSKQDVPQSDRVTAAPGKKANRIEKKKVHQMEKDLLARPIERAIAVASPKETIVRLNKDSFPVFNTTALSPFTEAVATVIAKPRFRIAHANELRTPVVPIETLNDPAKPAYSFLPRPAYETALAEPLNVEEQPVKKHPKTLIGLFHSN